MSLNDYQIKQEKILYQDDTIHKSHYMFLDMDDLWLGCLKCKNSMTTINGSLILKQECKG